MGTMSGGRFYGPSAMSSVSSSRMNKILQDVSRFLSYSHRVPSRSARTGEEV